MTEYQHNYIRENVKRVNFSYRRKYDYPFYQLLEGCSKDNSSRNNYLKKAIQYDMEHRDKKVQIPSDFFKPFPKNVQYKKQFSVNVNKNQDAEICQFLEEMEKEMPIAYYLRYVVYKYAHHLSNLLKNIKKEVQE